MLEVHEPIRLLTTKGSEKSPSTKPRMRLMVLGAAPTRKVHHVPAPGDRRPTQRDRIVGVAGGVDEGGHGLFLLPRFPPNHDPDDRVHARRGTTAPSQE